MSINLPKHESPGAGINESVRKSLEGLDIMRTSDVLDWMKRYAEESARVQEKESRGNRRAVLIANIIAVLSFIASLIALFK